MSDPRDIASLPMVRAPYDGLATIYLYDRVPGGIGLARRAYGMDRQIMRSALEMLELCPCASGCPSCVGPGGEAGAAAKRAAQVLLKAMAQ